MIENYMDYSYDRCMNIFTKEQIMRMHMVLENSPRRKSLLTSPALEPDEVTQAIAVYPNPATDKIYISIDEKILGSTIEVTAYTLLGKMLFKNSFTPSKIISEVPISNVQEKIIILTIETSNSVYKQLIRIN
jgi:hypothetical protein